jgi:N6-L-threonylcarbamoyladenine synthase
LLTLGIETSCDETGVALYDQEKGILSNELFSQIDLHKSHGGVIPELASRTQLEKINEVFHAAFASANVSIEQVSVIAATNRPGLPGSLLVGLCFAKAVAWAHNKKLIGVNHLEGHVFSAAIENSVPFPHLCLTASGGHTSIYYVKGFGSYDIVGTTRDDAAGEAFDKISKLMDLGYPGGPIIEKLAQKAGFADYFNYPRATVGMLDFSFSGLKTAVLYDLVKRNAFDLQTKQFLKKGDELFASHVASSLLVCIGDIFVEKVALTLKKYPLAQAITFVGGCAANNYLKSKIKEFCAQKKLSFFAPSLKYCTDNAAMIAFVGNYKAQKGEFDDYTLDI